MKKRVLVTGASGFFGRACLPILSAGGFEVHAVASRAGSFLPLENIRWHAADLLDENQIAALGKAVRAEYLLHAAWCPTTPGAFWNDANNPRWVRASLQLLEAFAQHGGRRAVLAGTCAEYDWAAGVCDEASTLTLPATTYGRCKLALFLSAQELTKDLNLSLAWGRLFFLFGPHEHPRRLVASIARALLQNEAAPCSSGEQERDFLHVADAASAFAALLDADVEGAVNVASGEAVAIKAVAEQIADIIGRRELLQIGALSTPANDPPLIVADTSRLRNEVNWSPRYDLESGLRQTVAWWKENL